MYELIKSSLQVYAFVAVFSGLWILLVVYGMFKKTKKIENKKIKTVLRFGISGVLVCLWAWHFVYINLYPISLAYYEYSRNSVEEKIGVINSIEQDGKDRINLIIDNTEYTMVYSSLNSDDIISRDIDEGDTVKIEFGVKSKYIFDTLNGADGIVSVSGIGLMIGIETQGDVSVILSKCMEKGILPIKAKNKLRLLPALNIPMELLVKAVDIIKEVAAECK